MKRMAGVEQNKFGFWVGTIDYPNGVHACVTNAFNSRGRALEVAQRMAEQADETDALDERRTLQARRYGYLGGHNVPGSVTEYTHRATL